MRPIGQFQAMDKIEYLSGISCENPYVIVSNDLEVLLMGNVVFDDYNLADETIARLPESITPKEPVMMMVVGVDLDNVYHNHIIIFTADGMIKLINSTQSDGILYLAGLTYNLGNSIYHPDNSNCGIWSGNEPSGDGTSG